MIEVMLGRRSIDLPYTVRFYGVTEAMFDEIVDEDTKAELLDGVMIVHSPATMEHDDIGGFIRALTSCYVDSKGSGQVYGPDSLVHWPPVGGSRRTRTSSAQKRVPRRRPKQFEGGARLVDGGVVGRPTARMIWRINALFTGMRRSKRLVHRS